MMPANAPPCGHAFCYATAGCVLQTHAAQARAVDEQAAEKVRALAALRRRRLAQTISATIEQLRVAKLVRSFAAFVRASWHVLEPDTPCEWNWHHDALCLHIQVLIEEWAKGGKRDYQQLFRNLVINVPPGTLKSRIVSVCALPWIWLRWPGFKLIAISENPQVALRDADACREVLRSRWYRTTFAPTWTLREDMAALGNFANTVGGSRRSFGSATRVIGLRGDAIFADDPNDPYEVLSPASRASTTGRWRRTSNRVNDERRSVRVIIQQRVHEADLTGVVLESGKWSPENPTGWLHLCIPTEFDPLRACETPIWKDPRTERGESIHPARYTKAVIAQCRVDLGAYGYAGQHDQNPSPSEGGMFPRRCWKWFRLAPGDPVKRRPHGCMTPDEQPARVVSIDDMDWLAITVDASFKDLATSDRTSIQVWGGKQSDRFLIRDWTKTRGFESTRQDIARMRMEFPRATKILIEDAANGIAVIETLTSLIGGVLPVKPKGGKASRAFACSPFVEAGNVYILDGADFAEPFVEEHAVFPNGKNDDRVDGMTQLLIEYGVSPALAKILNAYGSR